ncbi:ATP-binding protein [Mitsuaria sp. 7]|uniref:nSTAND3 domain-containing NTPase n=1 Tax=Mitsuaria sp. 7 TaxID=1658665 RepID=UPI0007DCF8B6|nr:ATP-binding protein [Mitsuaria sp. 7]ANH67761.1 hypothetical protein ABE85_09560 [Mitsuaria sp. 7]
MSIEIIGPRAYRFQDRVCVLLAIRAAHEGAIEMQIEPVDGEDAMLLLTGQGSRLTVDVQVKSEQGAITATKLVDWLTHFPYRQATDSLIEKLISDPSRSVLFVAGGRCTDATADHLVRLAADRFTLDPGIIKLGAEAAIRDELRAYAAVNAQSDGKTDKLRRAHVGRVVESITSSAFRAALHRVLLVEQQNDEEVIRETREELLSKHRVVPDHIDRVLREIEDIVFREKRTGNDVIPEIAAVVASGRSTNPLVSAAHVERSEEQALREQLANRKAVLISGAPRVGKSFIARSLAAGLQKQGFRVQVFGGVAEGGRFLLEPVDELRAALVDDPLGGSHTSDNAWRELQQLEQLIPRLGTSRRLIVAQAQDRLLEATREPSVQGLLTAGHAWITLGPGSPTFLQRVWRDAARSHQVPTELEEQVSRELLTGALDLEPGCLVHLASRHHQIPAGAHPDEVVRLARQDAKALGSALRAEKLGPLLTALAVGSTPELRVGETELAFILDATRTDRPGESDVLGTMMSVGPGIEPTRSAEVSTALSYDPLPQLSEPELGALEQLELRRMLSEVHQTYTFSHPFYRASAESLLDAATRKSRDAAVQQLERAIFTVAPESAIAAATNLQWVHRNLSGSSGDSGVVEVAKKGLSSVFPTVRELCFAFLVKQLPSMPEDEQGAVSDWLRKITWPRLSHVVWTHDQPRIPPADAAGSLAVDPFPERIPKSEIEGTLNVLGSDRPQRVSTQAAARAVQFLAENPSEMTAQMAARLLSYDVSLIRAPAAKAWLRIPRGHDAAILERIFAERSPSIAQAVYRGVVKAWSKCDEQRRQHLIEGLRGMSSSPATAAALIDDLVLIARREHGGTPTPWPILEATMPVVLGELPLGASIRDERLFDVVEKAIGNISEGALTAIIDRWIDLVARIAVSGGIPSDYMLGVSDIVLSGMPSIGPGRMDRMKRLLELTGTASRIRVVADLVVGWDNLSDLERNLLLSHLVADARDAVWIQASALTRFVVPEEIQEVILQASPRLSDSAEDMIAAVNPSLLNACVNVFTGGHPTIYYMGVHGSRSEEWKAIVLAITRKPQHELFEMSWEWTMAHDEVSAMTHAISVLGPDHANRVAGLLLARKRRTSGEFFPEVWAALFDLPVDESIKSRWIDRMVDIAPAVLDSLKEGIEWVPEARQEVFLQRLQPDYLLVSNISTLLKSNEVDDLPAEVTSSISALVSKLLEDSPPKFRSTYDFLKRAFVKMKVQDKGLMSSIAKQRAKTLKLAQEDRPKKVYPTLSDWIGPK